MIWISWNWYWTGDMPLFEPMMAQFTDAYLRQPVLMC